MHSVQRSAFCITPAGLGEDDANANKFEIFSAFSYSINGRAYSKALTANLALSGAALANHRQCAFFVLIDAAGAVTVQQSSIKVAPTGAGYEEGAWDWPDVPNRAVIGAIKVVTNGSSTFTPDSTDLGASNVTDTYFNVALDYGTPIPY